VDDLKRDAVAIHVRFYGTVQGVGFRATVRHLCIAAHISGWVRNLEDGSVEAMLFGSRTSVDSALRSITTPSRFRIERVDSSEAPSAPRPDAGFEIRR
jgi:acylphosphatase